MNTQISNNNMAHKNVHGGRFIIIIKPNDLRTDHDLKINK